MNVCCDCHKPFIQGTHLFLGGSSRPICNNCYSRLQREIGEAMYSGDSNKARTILNSIANNGEHSALIINNLTTLLFQAINIKYPFTLITIVRNGRDIGINNDSGNVLLFQKANGQIMFDTCMDDRFIPQGFSWNGPQYNVVSVSQASGGIKTKEKSKSKRKGGLVGAAVGTVLMPGVGTAIGYAATSRSVKKGKTNARDNTRIETQQKSVEQDTIAILKLQSMKTNRIIAIGVKCNSDIAIDLKRFNFSQDNQPYVQPVQPQINTNTKTISASTEDEKISALRNYKKLLDEGIISEAEYRAKKEQLLR